MKNEILSRFKNDLEALKRDMEGQTDDFLMWAEQDVAYMEKAITWLESIAVPLNPYTCDLMVGDVVEATFDEDGVNKLIVIEDMGSGTFNFWNYTELCFMCLPDSAINKLIYRNGAVIYKTDTLKTIDNE